MEKSKKTWGKASVNKNYCVACGECIKHCKVGAITINKGCYAIVDEERCVGCKRCIAACPASTIEYKEAR